MEFGNYGEEIQNLTDRITKSRIEGQSGSIEDCRKLISIGNAQRDSFLLGAGYFYLAEAYFCQNDCQNFMENITKGVGCQRDSFQWNMLVRSHNMLGIYASTHGNIAMAVDQFITALGCAKKHGLFYEMGLVYSNIGSQYMSFREYTSAVCYLEKARAQFLKCQDLLFAKENLTVVYIALGRCCLALGNLKGAEYCEEEARKFRNLTESQDEIFFRCICARIRHAQGRDEERDALISGILQELDFSQSFLNCEEEIFDFISFLLKIRKYEELKAFFPRLESAVDALGITHLKMKLLRRQAKLFIAVENRAQYLECCAKLYEYGELLKEENASMIRHATEMRFQLEEAKHKEEKLREEKAILKERSEKDALTGLPNRYRLNDVAEQMFRRAYQRRENLAVEIFDTDYFKQYNDTYGHQAGDHCLKGIGRILNGWMDEDPDIFCARYGGDEFVVICYGKSDREIRQFTNKLRKQVEGMKLENKASQVSEYVTVSQGICSSVPIPDSRVWDYLHLADEALYKVKQQKRNGICVVSGIDSKAEESVRI